MSLKVEVQTAQGKSAGSVDLPEEIFNKPASVALLHQVVIAQLAAARQGTHAVKNRHRVRGGGKKPYRQKGTGNARQGSIRAPQFAGGAVAHGPVSRDYSQRTNKKMIAAALKGALTDRAQHSRIHVIDEVLSGQTPSTKTAKAFLEKISERKKQLVVLGREDITAWLSVNNLPHVHAIAPDQLNTYDVLNSDDVIFTLPAFQSFVEAHTSKAAKEVNA